MLKTTFGDLQQCFQPLAEFGQRQGYEPKTVVRIVKTMKAVQNAYAQMEGRAKVIKQEVEDATAKITDKTKVETMKEAMVKEKMGKLFDEEITIDTKPIKLSILGNQLPVPGHLLALEWFFVDDISEADEE